MGHRLPAALGAATLTLVILALAARPAPARTITGTSGDDVLVGTPSADRVHGLAGSDDITGGKGDDRLFGGGGFDTFRWTRGDGYDQVDGGADSDVLEIEAGRRLRLHLNALGDGPKRPAKGGLQVIGLKRVEEIRVVGTDRGDGLVLSSDPGIVPSAPFLPPVTVDTGRGDDRIDVRR